MGIAFIFALIGITLDLVKTVSPTFIPTVARQNSLIALLLISLTVVLMAISIIASISAIEKGASQMTIATKQNVALTEQIKFKKLELNNLQLLSKTQLNANQITKADKTARDVSRVTNELNALYQVQSTTKGTSLLSQYDSKITLLIAIAIEVVSVVMAFTLHALNTLDVSVRSVPSPISTRVEPPSVNQSTQRVLPSVSKDKTLEVHFVASVLDEIKEAILKGTVKPSYRGLKTAFGLSQEKSKQVLSALHEQQILEPWNNNGYRLRTT
ncbi:hypothetical protein [Aliivibrio fischeri]|uniref:hypothetical protein n=1 Tax=Aliivibrio fischeri TaxID=668 RepID=UPI001F244D8B|nr:hypothetical protein [Aliivibrio fischeri]